MVWKIGDFSLRGFKTLEEKFVGMDKVPACALEDLAIVITIINSRFKKFNTYLIMGRHIRYSRPSFGVFPGHPLQGL